MTIFDYKTGGLSENGLGLKLEDGVLTARRCNVADVQFNNFPRLQIKGIDFLNCVFDGCGKLDFTGCDLIECSIRETTEIVADETKFVGCVFSDMEASDFSLMEIYDTKLQNCRFSNIVLRDEVYLCDAYPDCSVERCVFENCWTNRVDMELFLCEEGGKGVFKRKKWVDILDDESSDSALRGCNFLDD